MVKRLIIATVVAISPLLAVAQGLIKGHITDVRTGDPLIGASVIVKSEKSQGVVTDIDGNFSLQTKVEAPLTLRVEYVGYRPLDVDVYDFDEPVEIQLIETSNNLEGIVVTGVAQGTSRKGLSFALTKVSDELISTVPQSDASTTLRGKVAGIRIEQSNGNSGAKVYLRGAKSINGNIEPLIVVDGFVTSLSLSDINPTDIETIEIVKGAAASALYGTRGEGGVIQIITKKGKGNKLIVTLDNEIGFSHAINIPKTSQYHHYKVNSDGSFALNQGGRVIDYQDNGYSVNLHSYVDPVDNISNLLSDQPFLTNTVSLGATGDLYNFYASFQNQSKGGVTSAIDPDKKQSFLFNLGYKPVKGLTTEFTAQYSVSNNPSYVANNSNANGLVYSALLLEPFVNLAQKDAEGNYMVAPDGLNLVPTQFSNPLYEFTNRQYEYVTKNLLLGWKARYQISKLFSAEAAYSIQRTDYQTENYYPVGYETLSVDATKNNGYYEKTIRQTNTRNAQFQFNYNQKVGDFDLSAAFKSVYEYEKIDGFSANGYNLTAPVKSLDITDASTRSISSVWQKTVNYGYFLNFKGSWKDKWYLDVLGRLDKSSRFGSDVSWAFFPRVSLAYRLTQDFKLGPVNELKLRVAYGEAGSLPPYGAKDSRVTLTNSGGVSFTQNANTNLKRAITSETELGFDAVIWNWLNVQFNYAFAYSKNDFISVPSFTPLQGSATIYDNLGKVKSNSLELEVSGRIINSKNFSWDAGLTFSRVRSEITDMGDIPAFTDGDYRRDKGLSTSTIWGYGIFTSLNQLRTNEAGFVTNAGDGTKTLNDYTVNSLGFVVEKAALGTKNEAPVFYVDEKTGNTKVIGDAQPDFTVGFTNTLTYGPFSLYASLDWKKGGQKYNETVQYLAYVSRSEFDDKAAKAGLPLTFATQVFNAELPTDYWVEDAGYLSLRELSLSYNIPVARLGLGQWIKNARFALLGRNLFILTKFTGVNVDGDDYDGSAGTSDFFNYPSYRTLSAKLTIDF